MARKRKKKNNIIPFIIFMLMVIAGYFALSEDEASQQLYKTVKEKINNKVEMKIKIIDEKSNTRPIAVMINNHPKAVPNHAGLQDAYLLYEVIVEGGYTRIMALYKDKTTDRIGSVRSSRHYFLDYAMENDAIYVHFGWSPKAQTDISSYAINNINGLYDNAFWRDTSLNVAYEHTAFTSMEKINQIINKKGYRNDTKEKTLLNYDVYNIDISNLEGATSANNVVIPYSYIHTTKYEYDANNKVYKRYMNDKAHTDAVTKEQYTTKNIIIQKVYNFSMDSYGRQDMNNVGTGEGYFITNGYAVPITWSKNSRKEKTIYKYLDGNELKVNDGNTYIQIQPSLQNPTFS